MSFLFKLSLERKKERDKNLQYKKIQCSSAPSGAAVHGCAEGGSLVNTQIMKGEVRNRRRQKKKPQKKFVL